MDPELDRSEEDKERGLYSLKSCEAKCVGADQLCDNSCGHSTQYCWSPDSTKCLSVKEKSEKVAIILWTKSVDIS